MHIKLSIHRCVYIYIYKIYRDPFRRITCAFEGLVAAAQESPGIGSNHQISKPGTRSAQ